MFNFRIRSKSVRAEETACWWSATSLLCKREDLGLIPRVYNAWWCMLITPWVARWEGRNKRVCPACLFKLWTDERLYWKWRWNVLQKRHQKLFTDLSTQAWEGRPLLKFSYSTSRSTASLCRWEEAQLLCHVLSFTFVKLSLRLTCHSHLLVLGKLLFTQTLIFFLFTCKMGMAERRKLLIFCVIMNLEWENKAGGSAGCVVGRWYHTSTTWWLG